MTEYGLPFDGLLVGDATKAPYSAAEWARAWQLMHSVGASFPDYGVFKGTGNGTNRPLEALATAPVSSNVAVQIGAALVNGRFYETTAIVTLAVAANASGNARIDTVILRLDFSLQTVRLIVKQGTPAASPVPPTMQQDAVYWEIPIADIAAANGFVTLAQSTITYRARFADAGALGWMPFAYPLHYITGATYSSSSITLVASGGQIALPFHIAGNMLLQQVSPFNAGAGIGYTLRWDIFVQDVNNGRTAENTPRWLGGSGAVSGAAGPNQNVNLAASPGPIVLSPGMYWVLLQNRDVVNNFPLGRAINGVAVGNTAKTIVNSTPDPVPLDLVTGWSNVTDSYSVRLGGRVLGQATAF